MILNNDHFKQADTMKMFWAYGEKDVTQLDRISFKAKGSRPIYLLNPAPSKPKDTSVFHWDVTMKEVLKNFKILIPTIFK